MQTSVDENLAKEQKKKKMETLLMARRGAHADLRTVRRKLMIESRCCLPNQDDYAAPQAHCLAVA